MEINFEEFVDHLNGRSVGIGAVYVTIFVWELNSEFNFELIEIIDNMLSWSLFIIITLFKAVGTLIKKQLKTKQRNKQYYLKTENKMSQTLVCNRALLSAGLSITETTDFGCNIDLSQCNFCI